MLIRQFISMIAYEWWIYDVESHPRVREEGGLLGMTAQQRWPSERASESALGVGLDDLAERSWDWSSVRVV